MARILNLATAVAVLFGAASFAAAQQTEDPEKKLDEIKTKYEKHALAFEVLVKTLRRQMDEDFRTVSDMIRKVRSGEKAAPASAIPGDDTLSTLAADLKDDYEHTRTDVKAWTKRVETRVTDQRNAWKEYVEYLRSEKKDGVKSPRFPAQGALVTVFRDLSDDVEHLNTDTRRWTDRAVSRFDEERKEWATFNTQVRKEGEKALERLHKDFEELLGGTTATPKKEDKK